MSFFKNSIALQRNVKKEEKSDYFPFWCSPENFHKNRLLPPPPKKIIPTVCQSCFDASMKQLHITSRKVSSNIVNSQELHAAQMQMWQTQSSKAPEELLTLSIYTPQGFAQAEHSVAVITQGFKNVHVTTWLEKETRNHTMACSAGFCCQCICGMFSIPDVFAKKKKKKPDV